MYWPNLKIIALPVPEIAIAVTGHYSILAPLKSFDIGLLALYKFDYYYYYNIIIIPMDAIPTNGVALKGISESLAFNRWRSMRAYNPPKAPLFRGMVPLRMSSIVSAVLLAGRLSPIGLLCPHPCPATLLRNMYVFAR